MKLLIFAHTPPPHHGQSYMVKLMLDGFGGDRREHAADSSPPNPYGIDCYHVNARVSRDLEDIGSLQFVKIFKLLGHCAHAIWCRYRYGVKTMYYVPAPGKKSALFRDWLVMFLCRPFFPRIILHWHAAGLGKWLETHVQMPIRSMTYRRMKSADLSIVLSAYNRADAEKLFPKEIRVVNNGIPDPCPQFEREILPRRTARLNARRKLAAGGELSRVEEASCGEDSSVFKVLYLAHCTRDKGLFDSIDGVILANERLVSMNSPLTIQLQVAGSFFNREEEMEFEKICATPGGKKGVRYLGFVSGGQKETALRDSDFFCFPTFFRNENQPVNLIEAMAFGLPILTSRWRSIPELFPAGSEMLVDIQSPDQVADALLAGLTGATAESFREIFMKNFNLDQYLSALARAFQSVDQSAETPGQHSTEQTASTAQSMKISATQSA